MIGVEEEVCSLASITCLVDLAREITNLYGRYKVSSLFVVFTGTLPILLLCPNFENEK